MERRVKNASDYNPLLSSVRENPFPYYSVLRETEPVYFHKQLNAWVISRYEDILGIFRDPRFSSNRLEAFTKFLTDEEKRQSTFLLNQLAGWGFYQDPPSHTRLRSLYGKAFSASVVERLRGQVEKLVRELIARALPAKKMDVVKELAARLPVIVIAELLGVPERDHQLVKKWAEDINAFVAAPIRTFPLAQRAQKTAVELDSYFRKTITEKRKNPRQDLISDLILVEEHRAVLTDEEIVATCAMMVFAGHETTAALISNTFLSLLQFPQEFKKLRARPELIPMVVEEVVRYAGPVQLVMRAAAVPIEMREKKLKSGEGVILLLAAANRDQRQFKDPDVFDIERTENRHLGWGFGTHFCVGAQLAKMEAQLVLKVILEVMPDLRLSPQTFEWSEAIAIRTLQALWIEF